jgi:hypothetical protein
MVYIELCGVIAEDANEQLYKCLQRPDESINAGAALPAFIEGSLIERSDVTGS